MENNEIYRIKGTDIRKNTRHLLDAVNLTAEIMQKSGCFDADTRIVIKPNLVCPSPAEFGATTHPEIVEELICYLKEAGYRNITIMEGSWVGDKTADAADVCGFAALSEKYDVPFVDTKKKDAETVDCRGMELEICRCALQAEFLINVPVLKGHCQTKMTCALKNMKGLIPDREKRRFHKLGLHEPIAHLNTGLRQDFILVDDICGDPDFEEGGNPQNSDCILAAKDPVLVDAYACEMLGWKTSDVPYVLIAERLGVGSSKDRKIIDLGEMPKNRTEFKNRRLLDVSFALEDTDTCSACYSSLTEALWRLQQEGLLCRLDTKIGIGQGMTDKTGKLGIGRCTAKFDINVMGCPAEPEDIYRTLKEYILNQEKDKEQ